MSKSYIDIVVKYSDVIEKVKVHLALMGKRARDQNGNSLFSELTTSTAEDVKVWSDLINLGAETLVGTITPITGSYTTSAGELSFKLMSTRWKLEGEENAMDISRALAPAIHKYLWMFTVYQYLAIIRPSGDYAQAYSNACDQELLTIRNIGMTKRAPKTETPKYSSITGEIINED